MSSFKTLLLVVFVGSLFLLTSCHTNYYYSDTPPLPKLASINIIDRNGLTEIVSSADRLKQYENVNFLEPQPYQKVLRVYSRDYQGNIRAFITSYYPNGFPKQYLEVVNSRAFGVYKEWHSNGVLRIDAHVIGGTADIVNGAEQSWSFEGECLIKNDRDELEATFFYVKGELEGIAVYYHPNGKPWKFVPYHKNQIEGTLEVFQEDGLLLQKLEYVNGLKHGPSFRYWDGEKISTEEMYSEGLLLQGRYYDSCGELVSQIDDGNGFRALFGRDSLTELQEYRAGYLNGQIKTFNSKNRLTSIFHIKNGLKHGEEICFYDYPSLQKEVMPKISLTWYDGKIQGVVKTWYDNGFQESQREMSNNARNGHSSAWYSDGSLMMIEEYDSDKLVKGEYYSKGEKQLVGEVRMGRGLAVIYDGEGTFLRKIIYENGSPVIER